MGPRGGSRLRELTDLLAMIAEAKAVGRPVVASVAPSFAGHLADEPAKVLAALRGLGFVAVEETAAGIALAAFRPGERAAGISSACPRVVRLIETEYPHLVPKLSPRPSALLAHCRDLRRRYGDRCLIVFFGPCRYKAWEKHRHAEAADLVVTFDRLARWLASSFGAIPAAESARAEDTAPPADSGAPGQVERVAVLQTGINGLNAVRRALANGEAMSGIELLACPGGCLGGPRETTDAELDARRRRVLQWALDDHL